MRLTIRPATSADTEIEACARIIYEAYKGVAARHNFPPTAPTIKFAARVARHLINRPTAFAIVAEAKGRIVGLGGLDEYNVIRGLGPLAVDPAFQGQGIGQKLMEALLDRGRDAPGIRLTQETFNLTSMALYISFGFEVKTLTMIISGRPKSKLAPDIEVRPLKLADLAACARLCQKIHGFDWTAELRDYITRTSHPLAILRKGAIKAHATAVATFGHGVAKTEEDMKQLILAASALSKNPLSLRLPTEQTALLRWCLKEGFHLNKPITLMTRGMYQEPKGSYFISSYY